MIAPFGQAPVGGSGSRVLSLEEGRGNFDIVYTDPPWPYYGSETKDAAAGKHYKLMSMDDINAMPIKDLFRDPKRGAAFIWATCPRLHFAIDAIKAWGLHYRGVAFVWVKTRKDGQPIGAQGVPPTGTKPTTELCLLATTLEKGRPFPLVDAAVSQTIFAPRGAHSQKPPEVRDRILRLYGDRPRIELFAREAFDGWSRWGNQAP
jgi:N6-adenosine-specific RNA methylase IME4